MIQSPSRQFGVKSKNIQSFHAHGLMVLDVPDNALIPISVDVDQTTDLLTKIVCVVRCDFANFAGDFFARMSKLCEARKSSRVYSACYARFSKRDIAADLLCSADALAQVLGESRALPYAARKRHRDERVTNDQILLSNLYRDGLSMCVENSLIAHRWLKMQGIESSYIGGAVYNPATGSGAYHAFLAVRGKDNAVFILEPGAFTRTAAQDAYLPAIYHVSSDAFERFIERGTASKSWLRTESIWDLPATVAHSRHPAEMFYGFDSLVTQDSVRANLVNPKSVVTESVPQIHV